jgi:hypothetical protein
VAFVQAVTIYTFQKITCSGNSSTAAPSRTNNGNVLYHYQYAARNSGNVYKAKHALRAVEIQYSMLAYARIHSTLTGETAARDAEETSALQIRV